MFSLYHGWLGQNVLADEKSQVSGWRPRHTVGTAECMSCMVRFTFLSSRHSPLQLDNTPCCKSFNIMFMLPNTKAGICAPLCVSAHAGTPPPLAATCGVKCG
jgi:hypothetical protein